MKTELNTSFHFYNISSAEITNSSALHEKIKHWYSVEDKVTSESLERRKLGLPDISVRSALEKNGWISQTPVDSVIEWMCVDSSDATAPENVSLLL